MPASKKPFPLREGEKLGAMRTITFPGVSRVRQLNDEERAARGITTREDARGRTLYSVAVSSETEVERWFGVEILGHGPGEIVMDRFDNGAQLLMDHDPCDVVGVIERGTTTIGKDKVMRTDVRFSSSARATEVRADVDEEIRSSISVGYFIHDWEVSEREVGEDANGRPMFEDVYRITSWEPAEVSIVAIPADVSVGVGRSASGAVAPEQTGTDTEARNMDEEQKKAAEAAARAAEESRTATATATAAGREGRSREVSEILKMAKQNNMGDRAAKWIEDGLSADAVARAILDEHAERAKAGTAQAAAENVGNRMDRKDRRRYSYQRAIRMGAGMVARERGDSAEESFSREKFDGLEAEVHQQLAKDRANSQLDFRGGVLVPMDLRSDEERWLDYERRSLDSKTVTKGTETVFERAGEMIELLRNVSVLGRMGTRFLGGLSGPIAFVKQTGGLSVYWVGENPPADVTSSDIAFALVNMVAKTMQATTGYTRQLLVQTSLDIEQMIREEFSIAHALKLDKSGLYGIGANGEPTGIYNWPDVNVKPVGGTPDLEDVIGTEILVAEDNALLGNVGWVTTPGLAGKMRQTLEFAAAGARPLWDGNLFEGNLGGYRAMTSNQVSKTMTGSAETGGNEHGCVFGNFSDQIVGLFQSMELIVDPYAQKKRGIIEVTSFQMADIICRHGESFAKWTGATG